MNFLAKNPIFKKKITYIITRSDIGGAQFHTLYLIKEFQKDYDILLITGTQGILSEQVKALNVRVKVVPAIDSFNFISATLKIRKILAREKPDLIHVHSSLASFYGRCAAKLVGQKTLYTVHGWHFSNEPSRLKRLIKINVERFLKRFTHYWITVSEFDSKLGEKHQLFKKEKFETIANGVKQQTHQIAKKDSTLQVIFVGRASYQKNCKSAIKVISYTNADIHLTIYASGDAVETLQSLIDSSQAKNRITLLKNQPNAAAKMPQYSVMLITSRYEGMPLSALEAMRAGLTLVSTDVCGMNEIVIEGKNGYLFPEDNEQKMAKVLDSLARDSDKLERMGRHSQLLYNEKFTVAKMLDATHSVYRKLC